LVRLSFLAAEAAVGVAFFAVTSVQTLLWYSGLVLASEAMAFGLAGIAILPLCPLFLCAVGLVWISINLAWAIYERHRAASPEVSANGEGANGAA
jgi:hypothetical protein